MTIEALDPADHRAGLPVANRPAIDHDHRYDTERRRRDEGFAGRERLGQSEAALHNRKLCCRQGLKDHTPRHTRQDRGSRSRVTRWPAASTIQAVVEQPSVT